VGENVVEELGVVVARAFAVRAPVDLQDLRRHRSLSRIVPEKKESGPLHKN
jgi:hypothetical protein